MKTKVTVLTDGFFLNYTEDTLIPHGDAITGATISCIPSNSVSTSKLIDSEVVFGWIPPAMLKELTNLKWMHLPSAGANNYTDITLYANPSIIVTKSSGTFGIPIAEHVLGMMISLSRSFMRFYDNQKEAQWRRDMPESLDVFGSTVLVLGLGDIGTQVCRRLSGFDCNIIGFRHNSTVPHELVSEVLPISRLREKLPDADYIIVCLPGTDDTKHLIGREEFSLMKKRAIVVNIGRGFIIDSDALVDALNTRKIAGAGLDVTEPEPLPPGHPLWSAENVFITPHLSSSSPRNSQRRLAIFIDLLKRYLSGQQMYNIVDFNSGY